MTRLSSYLGGAVSLLFVGRSLQSADPILDAVLAQQCSWSKYGFPFPSNTRMCPRAVTDVSDDFAPWSYRPHCIQPALSSIDDQEYCVFTSTGFRAQGVSIITTPDIGVNVVEYLDDTSVPERLRNHPASTLTTRRKRERPYEIRNVKGRGKGVVTRRRIPKWETVMVGYPVMVVESEFLKLLDDEERQELKDIALAQLPEPQRKAVLALAHSTGGELIEDILKTNIFSIEIAGVSHLGLFLDGSRVNHHCKPNTFWRYSRRNMAQEVIATREIEAGEEITHSYTPLGLPYEDRQRALRGWGFNCTCSMCTWPQGDRTTSDMRRVRLYEVFQALAEGEAKTKPEIMAHVRELEILIRAEDLTPQLCEYYAAVARAYMGIGHYEDAREYAALSEEYWVRYGTEEHDNIEAVRELWEDIERAEMMAKMGPHPREYYEDSDEATH